jgi:putative iron-regulated protein
VLARTPRRLIAVGLAAALLGATACSDDKDDTAATTNTAATVSHELTDADALAAAATYADLVHATYTDVVTKAESLDTAIHAFVAGPSAATLQAAEQAWLDARVLYGPTEVYRFYDGPIDNPKDGPEGQINAWPLDEAYIDSVEGDPASGIVNDVEGTPEITTDVLVAANEQGGETNISTGWHAIEFLLWGQDLSATGPGARPVTDYTTSPVAERRGTYLTLLSDLLVKDLTTVRDAWGTEAGSYRETFLDDPHRAVSDILRGMGALSKAELAGERISVALESKDKEDEHSCFSDNTTVDVAGNAGGIRMAYLADYTKLDGTKVEGTSLSDVVAKVEPELDAALRTELDGTATTAASLVGGPVFDQLILGTDTDPGRAELISLVKALQDQGDSIADLAGALGYSVSLVVE